MKIRPVGQSCSTRKDGQTDMTKLLPAFCYFPKEPKNTYNINAFCRQNVELPNVKTGDTKCNRWVQKG